MINDGRAVHHFRYHSSTIIHPLFMISPDIIEKIANISSFLQPDKVVLSALTEPGQPYSTVFRL